MLTPTRWWVVTGAVDLRSGMNRLLLHVRDGLGRDARSGDGFVFCNVARSRIKVVWLDGTGVWLCVRRLHDGRFHWPSADAHACMLTPEQFAWLCSGVQWQRLSCRPGTLPTHL